ncbi:hypothetical protein [Microcoleus sp. bin38.metabat.b11b12b14.051]|nr:hypothetical protein [Microcoleus sp. bin38.metabat.b11b12b14.051]
MLIINWALGIGHWEEGPRRALARAEHWALAKQGINLQLISSSL